MFDKILKFFGSNIIKDVGDVVDKFVTTKEEKEKLKQEMVNIIHRNEMESLKASFEVEKEFNERIKEMEGTSKDLIQAGWLGKIVLFFRGLQRPLWGYVVIFLDYKVFSKEWIIEDEQTKSAFWIINFLVLVFLFGERAVKNVAPLISQLLKK